MDQKFDHVDQLTTVAKAKAFLGREFLTWLWYTAETTRERQKMPHPRGGAQPVEFDIWIDDRMVLEAASRAAQESQQSVMKGGDPSRSREAAAALSAGKTVRELKLGLHIKGVGEFSAVLGCDDLNPRSLKMPSPSEGDGKPADADEVPLAARIRYMDLFTGILDGMFAQFLEARTQDGWEEGTLQEIRQWIKRRQKGAESDTLH